MKVSFLVAAALLAQYQPTFPGCAKCGVLGYVDIPSTSATVSNADLLAGRAAVEGWGFECVSGNPVDRVDIFVEDEHTINFATGEYMWRPTKQGDTTWGGYNYRPDVELAFVAACPTIYARPTGFVRWIDQPLPLGAHRFKFLLWRGPYHQDHILTLNIVP